jgi:hypothetical protein
LARRKKAARDISKHIGSLGVKGDPPAFYYEFEAAEILRCSVIELKNHPQKHTLMREAFTVQRGRNEGEYARELNPEFRKAVKQAAEEISRARDGKA